MREFKFIAIGLALSFCLGLTIALTIPQPAHASGTCPPPPGVCETCDFPNYTMGPCCPEGWMEMWTVYYAIDNHKCEEYCAGTLEESTYFTGCFPPM